MLKFIKYELLGSRKFMLGTILFALGATTGLQLSLRNRLDAAMTQLEMGNDLFIIGLMGVLLIMLIGSYIATIIYIVSSFRKELYEDRGYLTFTLPISGAQLLGSKLLVSLFWVTIIGGGVFFYNIGLSSILFNSEVINFSGFFDILRQIEGINNIVIFLLVSTTVGSLLSLLLIYFSITVSKISLKGKTIGSLWVVLFFVINYIYSFVYDKITEIFPVYLDIQNLEIIGEREVFIRNAMSPASAMLDMSGSVPIVSSTFTIVLIVAVFMLTGYLLDKKVELE